MFHVPKSNPKRLWLYREVQEGCCAHVPRNPPQVRGPLVPKSNPKGLWLYGQTHVHLRRWDTLTGASEIPSYIFNSIHFYSYEFRSSTVKHHHFWVDPPFFGQPQLSSVEEDHGAIVFFKSWQDASRGLPETPPLQTYEVLIKTVRPPPKFTWKPKMAKGN